MHALVERVQRGSSDRAKRSAIDEVLALLRRRVLALETNIERRYMRAPYVSRYYALLTCALTGRLDHTRFSGIKQSKMRSTKC